MNKFGQRLSWQFLVFNLVIPVFFFYFAYHFTHLTEIFQFNTDEGIELIRVDLYQRGFEFYTQIWTDHPPLPAILWSAWLEVWGRSIQNARLLTLCFGTLLVWAFGHSLRLTVGAFPALVGVFLLTLSGHFAYLSAAVMMGVPALALVMVSIYLLLLHQRHSHFWLLLASGICFSFSLQIKAFTLFLLPILLFYLALSPQPTEQQPLTVRLKPLIVWVAGILIVAIAGLLLLPRNLDQSFLTHFNQSLREEVSWGNGWGQFFNMFIYDPDYWLLGGLGIWQLSRHKRWWLNLPGLWLFASLIVLAWHRPLWHHYYLLLSIPLIWLAAYAVPGLVATLRQRSPRWKKNQQPNQSSNQPEKRQIWALRLAIGLVALSVIGIPIKLMVLQDKVNGFLATSQGHFEVLAYLNAEKAQTQWLFTDLPLYGFYSELAVPPETAVLSKKRYMSGNVTPQQIREVVKTYAPEQMVLGRFDWVRVALSPILRREYDKVYGNDVATLYQRRDLPR